MTVKEQSFEVDSAGNTSAIELDEIDENVQKSRKFLLDLLSGGLPYIFVKVDLNPDGDLYITPEGWLVAEVEGDYITPEESVFVLTKAAEQIHAALNPVQEPEKEEE